MTSYAMLSFTYITELDGVQLLSLARSPEYSVAMRVWEGGLGLRGFGIILGQKLNFSKQLDILGPASGQTKIIENLTSHKTGPNSKSHTPWAPKG